MALAVGEAPMTEACLTYRQIQVWEQLVCLKVTSARYLDLSPVDELEAAEAVILVGCQTEHSVHIWTALESCGRCYGY